MKKKGNKKMPTPRHKVTHNPIPTSLFLSRPQYKAFESQDAFALFSLPNSSYKQSQIFNKDVGMGL